MGLKHLYQGLTDNSMYQADPVPEPVAEAYYDLSHVIFYKRKHPLITPTGQYDLVADDLIQAYDPQFFPWDLEPVLPTKNRQRHRHTRLDVPWEIYKESDAFDPSTLTFELPLILPSKLAKHLLKQIIIEEPPSFNPPALPTAPTFFESMLVRPPKGIKIFRPFADMGELWATASPSSPVRRRDFHPKKAGPLQGLMAKFDQYIATHSYFSLTSAMVADTVYYIPIMIPYTMHLEDIGVDVINETDAVCEVGIYSTDRGFIKDKLVSNTLTANSKGWRSTQISITLGPGFYFFAILADSTPDIRGTFSDYTNLLGMTDATDNNRYSCYKESRTYSEGLPATPGTIALSTDRAPRIIARITE